MSSDEAKKISEVDGVWCGSRCWQHLRQYPAVRRVVGHVSLLLLLLLYTSLGAKVFQSLEHEVEMEQQQQLWTQLHYERQQLIQQLLNFTSLQQRQKQQQTHEQQLQQQTHEQLQQQTHEQQLQQQTHEQQLQQQTHEQQLQQQIHEQQLQQQTHEQQLQQQTHEQQLQQQTHEQQLQQQKIQMETGTSGEETKASGEETRTSREETDASREEALVSEWLRRYEEVLLEAGEPLQQEEELHSRWTYTQALFFSATVLTTIGQSAGTCTMYLPAYRSKEIELPSNSIFLWIKLGYARLTPGTA
nr:bromodomain-containing protein DDB_G0280777-like [Cherax quadricarinatus]